MSRPLSIALVMILVASCGDAAGPGAGDAEKLIVDPHELFVLQGSERVVLVRVVDGIGSALNTSITLESIGPGISVVAAPGYPVPEETDGMLVFQTSNGELALSVSGEELTRTSFRVAAEGREAGITVTVLPKGRLPVQFSDAEMRLGDTLELEVSAPFTFRPDFELETELSGCGESVCFRTLDIGPDGRSATIFPLADFRGRIRLEGISLDYARELSPPGVPQNDELLVGMPPEPLPGTNEIASAPSITMPLPGEVVTLIDAPPDEFSDGEFSKYYRLVASRSASFGFQIHSRSGLYEFYLREVGAADWTWLGSSWSPGQMPLFNGTYILKITGDGWPVDYVRLDISAAPQDP